MNPAPPVTNNIDAPQRAGEGRAPPAARHGIVSQHLASPPVCRPQVVQSKRPTHGVGLLPPAARSGGYRFASTFLLWVSLSGSICSDGSDSNASAFIPPGRSDCP